MPGPVLWSTAMHEPTRVSKGLSSRRAASPVLYAVVCALSACAATVDPITTPRGRDGFVVTCKESPEGWAACYQAAADACEGRYRVIERRERAMRMVAECRGSRHD